MSKKLITNHNLNLDEDGAERARLPRAVMDRHSRPGPEPTTLEAVGNQWRYTLVVVQAGKEEDNLNPVPWDRAQGLSPCKPKDKMRMARSCPFNSRRWSVPIEQRGIKQ